MIRNFLSALLATAAVFLCVNCSGSTGVATPQRTAPPDPQWVTSISQHSNGAISRHSPVRVLFTNDVVPQERVGSDATANIGISPAVKMRATFTSRREIVLRAEPWVESLAVPLVVVARQESKNSEYAATPIVLTVKPEVPK